MLNFEPLIQASSKPSPAETPGSKLPKDLFTSLELKETRDSEALKGLFMADGASPESWKYLNAARVGITVPLVSVGSNDAGITAGDYVLINKTARAPIRAEHKLNFCYEFPGRAIKNEQESYTDIKSAAIASIQKEIGNENIQADNLTEISKNISASAGSSSQVFDIYSVELNPDALLKAAKECGADIDKNYGVVRINRQADGGIVNALELVPRKQLNKYLKECEANNDSIGASTFAAIQNLPKPSLWQRFKGLVCFWKKV